LNTSENSISSVINRREQRRIESLREDYSLIHKALEGEQDAFSKLLQKYKDSVSNIIFKIIHNKEEVDDLLQETFIKAFASLSSFNEQYSFSTWLYKIATNNCIDFLRKKKLKTFSINRTIDYEEGDTTYEIADTNYEADRILLDEQRKNFIQDAINSLPEKYKMVIILRHQQEKNYDEIAQILNIPIGTVKAHIFRAREMLNKYLKDKRFMI
jgi:RNA polymerase sigma factor (sigma-70 family)